MMPCSLCTDCCWYGIVSFSVEPIYGSVPGDLNKKGLDGIPLLESSEQTFNREFNHILS